MLAASALALSAPASAPAAVGFLPCPGSRTFQCGTLSVPLDRSGAVPGAVALHVERALAGPQQAPDAVVALAGGPGQATLPIGEFIAQAIAPALHTRDLLLFDQRGTGSSNPLSCPALEEGVSEAAVPLLFERCAQQIGPARGGFTTAESVEDIEALRRAAGYQKIVLYGTSYGTKVALDYAARYPQNVEALVLDSVVPPEGPEPFSIPTLQAIGPALEELCSGGACAAITRNPLGEVGHLASLLGRASMRGYVYDGAGHRHAATLAEGDLLDILEAGDLNPALRALLPAAIHSALSGDPDPLLRLHLLSQGLIPNLPSASTARGAAAGAGPARNASASGSDGVNEALFVDTSCEEAPFPWQRGAPAATKLAEATAAVNALPASTFYPFDAATALGNGLIPDCAYWPVASPAPPAVTSLPSVPTLILSGSQDLRTPTPQARGVSARIGGSQLLVVPFTGHSVLGSDLSGCASRALAAFFAGSPVAPCGRGANRFAPTPITPRRLSSVRPPSGLAGRPGRTLVAVLDTLVDLNRQVIGATLQAQGELPSGSSFGGLRGGYAQLRSNAVVLRRFSFVPGVELSGRFPISRGELQPATISIAGSAGSHGSVWVGSGLKRVHGTLDGRRFALNVARVHLSSAGAGEWPALARLSSALTRLAAARLAG